MSVVWFDFDGARRASTSWVGWGDQLAADSHTIRRRLDGLMMSGWDGGSTEVDYAADTLWTLAEFNTMLAAAVERADGTFPTSAGAAGAVWQKALGLTALRAPARDVEAAQAGLLRWLGTLSDEDALAYFTARYGNDPAAVLAQLSGDEAVLYFDALSSAERQYLIQERPELVVFRVLASGGARSAVEAEQFDRTNVYGTFTTTTGWGVDVSVGVRLITIEVGGSVTLVVTKNNDGSVEMTMIEEASVGVGAEIDVPRAAEASAAIGGFGELQQRFWFADEAAALTAVANLRDAALRDLSLSEIGRDLLGGVANAGSLPSRTAIDLANWVNPFGDPIPQIPTYDMTPEIVRAVQDMWLHNGLSHQEGVGVYGSAGAEFEANLGVIEGELGAEAEARLMFYDTDVADAAPAGTVGQTGVMFAGSISVDADGEVSGLSNDTGVHGAASAGFAADLFHVDGGGTYLTITLETDVATGASLEVIDFGAGEIDVTTDATAAMTMAMTVPVNADTSAAVGEAGVRLVRGELPVEEIRELYDASEVDITMTAGGTTDTEFEFDGAVIEIESHATVATSATQVSLHKNEGGELYSRVELDRLIDEAFG